jgi:hypothetical protein
MVLDLIQLAPPVHKVRADRAPVLAVEAPKDAQNIALEEWRDVAVATVLRRVCVSLGVRVRVGVKLTAIHGENVNLHDGFTMGLHGDPSNGTRNN